MVQAIYLPYGEGVGDCIVLFLDVTVVLTSGVNFPSVKKPNARRLKLQGPRLIINYNKCLKILSNVILCLINLF